MTDARLVYDDDCGFCTWWAEYFTDRSDLPLVGFSELDEELRARLPPGYDRCSHLLTDEARYSCGASLEEAFLRTETGSVLRPLVERLRKLRAYEALREWGYRRFAHNRPFWARVVSKAPPARVTDVDSRSDA